MFFLTIGPPALKLASPSAGTEVMGFLHMFADARMPIWRASAISCNFLLARVTQEWTALVLFRIAVSADSVRRYLCSLVKTY